MDALRFSLLAGTVSDLPLVSLTILMGLSERLVSEGRPELGRPSEEISLFGRMGVGDLPALGRGHGAVSALALRGGKVD